MRCAWMFLMCCCLLFPLMSAGAQVPGAEDVLLFKDGDRLTGELLRIELGAAVFRTNKTADVTVDFAHVAELRCGHRFAVLKYGVKVTQGNAVIGTLELKGDDLLVHTAGGATVTMPAALVAYAVIDTVFEREISRRPPAFEGWSVAATVGGSLVRSTEDGAALTTDFALTRQVPGVDYLPVRHSTAVGVRDTYEQVTRHDRETQTATENETHIFHAELEQNQYLSERVYALALYSFDRNYAQGLQAQHLFGGGAGWTVVKNRSRKLNLKTDFHRETQAFTDPASNVALFGQQFSLGYDQVLPRNLDFTSSFNYLPSYTRPHDYAANARGTVTVPLFYRFSLSVTAEDNYLNNALPGDRRNTFRASTGLRFSN